jgi:hypothetical protein
VWCEENGTISEFQGAYRKGVGCLDHIFSLRTIIESNVLSDKQKVYACFIDLSGAFDAILWSKLWSKLETLGVSTKFISMVKAIYEAAEGSVRTTHGMSNSFKFGKAILQGETLSPKLFTLFLEDLIKRLHNSDIPGLKTLLRVIHILLYADDIVLLANNYFDLQEKINLVSNYFKENGLTVNLSKTKVVIFRNSRKKFSQPKVFWDDEEIEIVNEYVYLGVTLNSKLNFSESSKVFFNKAQLAENQISNIAYRGNIRTLNSRLKLFDSLVKSVLLYSCPVWGSHVTEQLVVFQNKFIRKLFYLPQRVPGWLLRLETNSVSIEVTVLKHVLKFIQKIALRHSNSLLKDCFDTISRFAVRSAFKNNWFTSTCNLLRKWKCENLLINQPPYYSISGIKDYKIEISQAVRRFVESSVEADITCLSQSRLFHSYRDLKTHCNVAPFLNFNVPWFMIRLIVQLRVGLPQFSCKNKTTKLAMMDLVYDLVSDGKCNQCDLNEDQTLFHVIFMCPKFHSLRASLLAKYGNVTTFNEYAVWLRILSEEKITDIYTFLNGVRNIISP